MIYGTGRALEASTGRELWSVPFNEMAAGTPVVTGDVVFLAPFHGRNLGGHGCALVRVRDGRPAVAWNNDEVESLCLTGIFWEGHLYIPDRDDLTIAGENGRRINPKCLDAATGRVIWVHRPLPCPTPLLAGGRRRTALPPRPDASLLRRNSGAEMTFPSGAVS